MISSVGLPGNKYTNFALSSLATIPGDVIAVITLDRVGRKKTLLGGVIVCSWWWFTAAFVYYGLMISSVGLPGNKYTNFALSSLATIPGDVIAVITLDRVGRKKTLLGG
ncbi:jg23483, partial [Pararge aegeria aegeria]